MTTPATPAADAVTIAAWSKHTAVADYPEGYSLREHVLRAGREIATARETSLAQQHALELLSLDGQAMERESALVAERDALRAEVAVADRLLPILSNCLKHQQVNSASEIMRQIEQELAALAAPAVEG